MTGRLIVIDGLDGSGKNTQVTMLVERLRKEGVAVETLDFPGYKTTFFGKLIGEILAGKYGKDAAKIDPHIFSPLYAVDRWEQKPTIEKWLAEGKVVVLDRYVSANQIHQGGKISNPEEREAFLAWLDTMEHVVLKNPRPDLVIYLDVHPDITAELLKDAQEKKEYLAGGTDLVESNEEYVRNSHISALSLSHSSKNWKRVDCLQDGNMRSREDIHNEIYSLI